MAADAPDANEPLQGFDDLLRPFHAAETPRMGWRIGTEAEKFGVGGDGRAAPFEGERGVRAVLERLVERHGWHEQCEWEGGEVIALHRGRANITLEPGAQLELSGAPLDTIHQTCAEFRGHMAELRSVSEDLGLHWLGLGFHPLATQDELPWVPKLRYAVMREYLPTRGGHALDMMRRTCTVQANLDYADVEDAFRKLRVALRLQPIVTAMFANSPWVEGRATGERTHRARVWLDVDPNRQGLLRALWEGPARYERYVEWALDVPMFLVKRGGEIHRNTHQTFRQFMDEGLGELRATRGDWETHLNTLFPEARLKKTLEVRGVDSQRTAMICALPALWKGLLYDEATSAKAEALAGRVDGDALEAARPEIAKSALRAELQGRPVLAWAREVLELAESGLERLGNLNGSGDDERVHLAPLRALLERGLCPADVLLEQVPGDEPALEGILEHAHV
ncbi:MAG TPA: glutamate-cysteine ligase family protein [Polyangiaceae bacterium LLY-WYZ-15_(1-7)]|nr:glutamate-cysteine ligase family protein [Polyangiaceae bacterium LLY-WYZ-15_(1-7)]